jgi:hypothetical protein
VKNCVHQVNIQPPGKPENAHVRPFAAFASCEVLVGSTASGLLGMSFGTWVWLGPAGSETQTHGFG